MNNTKSKGKLNGKHIETFEVQVLSTVATIKAHPSFDGPDPVAAALSAVVEHSRGHTNPLDVNHYTFTFGGVKHSIEYTWDVVEPEA